MSVCAANAYLWPGTIQGLLKWFQTLQAAYYADAKEAIGRILQNALDAGVKRQNFSIQDYVVALGENAAGPFRFSCVVYQFNQNIVMEFFGLFGATMPRTNELILKDLSDFSYSDNSDVPEGISDEEYQLRKSWFEGLFLEYGSSVPSRIGLTRAFGDMNTMLEIAADLESEFGRDPPVR